ncbi:hypothetical protein MRX96_032237 [Rhipicephalus microplus]
MRLHCVPRSDAYTTRATKRAHRTPAVHVIRSKERARSDSRRQCARNPREWRCTTVSHRGVHYFWRGAHPTWGRDAAAAGYIKSHPAPDIGGAGKRVGRALRPSKNKRPCSASPPPYMAAGVHRSAVRRARACTPIAWPPPRCYRGRGGKPTGEKPLEHSRVRQASPTRSLLQGRAGLHRKLHTGWRAARWAPEHVRGHSRAAATQARQQTLHGNTRDDLRQSPFPA